MLADLSTYPCFASYFPPSLRYFLLVLISLFRLGEDISYKYKLSVAQYSFLEISWKPRWNTRSLASKSIPNAATARLLSRQVYTAFVFETTLLERELIVLTMSFGAVFKREYIDSTLGHWDRTAVNDFVTANSMAFPLFWALGRMASHSQSCWLCVAHRQNLTERFFFSFTSNWLKLHGSLRKRDRTKPKCSRKQTICWDLLRAAPWCYLWVNHWRTTPNRANSFAPAPKTCLYTYS